MPEWMQREQGNRDQKAIEIKPEMITDAMKPQMDAFKKEFGESIDAKLAPIADFLKAQKDKDEAERAKQQQQQRQQKKDDLEINPEDWITDPEGTTRKMLTPLQETVMAQSAIIMREKVLGKMDYYSSDPAFAAKVDALIDAQAPVNRANSSVIMNAYKSVHYDLQDDIKTGKIKSIAAASGLSNNGQGGHSGEKKKDDDVTTLSAEEKNYARKMGLSEEDWVRGKRELEYV